MQRVIFADFRLGRSTAVGLLCGICTQTKILEFLTYGPALAASLNLWSGSLLFGYDLPSGRWWCWNPGRNTFWRPTVVGGARVNIIAVATLPPHQGGSAISNALLLSGFAASGHAVRVLSPLSVVDSAGGDPFAAAHPEIAVTRFSVPFAEVSPNLPAPAAYRRVEREQINRLLPQLIEQDRPDLVFLGRETFAWDAPDIARRHAIPCVLRTAGAMTIGLLQGTLPAGEVWHLMTQYQKADRIICPAEHLAVRLRATGLSNVTAIWNGVDTDRFAPHAKDPALMRRWSLTHADVVIAHVSNLKSLKRPLDMIDAAALAAHDSRLQYLVVGDGPVWQAMEDACREQQLAARFRFTGWIEHDTMPAYLNLADIVVMPSEDEAQARVYLETQSCGRVILASDIAAAREVITDGVTGVLFRMGDAADLAASVLRLAHDAELRATIGCRARRCIAAHAMPTILRAYLDVFADVVARQRVNRPLVQMNAAATIPPRS